MHRPIMARVVGVLHRHRLRAAALQVFRRRIAVEPAPQHRVVDLGVELHAPGRRPVAKRLVLEHVAPREPARADGDRERLAVAVRHVERPVEGQLFGRTVHRLDRVVAELVEPLRVRPHRGAQGTRHHLAAEADAEQGDTGRHHARHPVELRAHVVDVIVVRALRPSETDHAAKRFDIGRKGLALVGPHDPRRPAQAGEQVRDRAHVEGRDVGHEQHWRGSWI